MSSKKKIQNTTTNKDNFKKFNPDVDIVPYHVSGFGVASNNKDKDLLILDFLSENFRSTSNYQIILGSYVISKRMAKDIIEMLNDALNEMDNTEIDNIKESDNNDIR
ncbi:hypothetical protein [Aliarcobacter cryaerophilus]|uniref:hypothetical protein n=1 Tax=Aliarcobacter cryaerophilus TaxID=28198 RepID=UPI0008345FE9|nr:hypothetical protein [Aliarcobacter cryaerophilus]